MLGIIKRRMVVTVLIALLLAGTAGCTEWLLATSVGSFAAGYLVGSSIGGETTCYHNGVLIDCADMPAELAP